MTPLAQALIAALDAKRMSQAELARQLGVSRETVSAYCRGDVIPPQKRIMRINEILGAELEARRKLTVPVVAKAMGVSRDLLMHGLVTGALSAIGAAIPSKRGKGYNYRFWPEKVKELVGID
jgi:transcriptional regulator with XRE-family HTH domain